MDNFSGGTTVFDTLLLLRCSDVDRIHYNIVKELVVGEKAPIVFALHWKSHHFIAPYTIKSSFMEPQGYKTSTMGQLPESAQYIVFSVIVTGLLASWTP